MNKFIALLVFSLVFTSSFAKKVEGYIVTNNHDTIHGQIRVSRIDMNSSSLVFAGVNLEPFFSGVMFKPDNESMFRFYQPNEIEHFAFTFKQQEYQFYSFSIDIKSLSEAENQRMAFLNLVYTGKVFLYHEIRRTAQTRTGTSKNMNDNSVVFSNYYLSTNQNSIIKVEKSDTYQNVFDLLLSVGIEDQFVAALPVNTDFKDISAVLKAYDKWLVK